MMKTRFFSQEPDVLFAGIKRETKEEFDFANFTIFDDPETPYSTFNFTYDKKSFDRLAQLTEFNTLQNIELIKNVIAEEVRQKRAHPRNHPLSTFRSFGNSSPSFVKSLKKKPDMLFRNDDDRGENVGNRNEDRSKQLLGHEPDNCPDDHVTVASEKPSGGADNEEWFDALEEHSV